MDEVTDATFATDVLSSDVPVIVEFGAPWCRPCRAIEPALTEIAAAAAGRVRLVKLDIDVNLGTPSRYGVLSVPTVILFVGGEARETLAGPQSKSRYERTFAQYISG
ncbi:MAG: thioredoxin domain-containing protein [Thermoleophilia bacterium]